MDAPPTSEVPVWIWLLLIVAALIASWTDIRETRIPNWLSLPLLAGGVIFAVASGGWAGLGDALLGGFVASVVFLWAYIALEGGAGDAKLMMGFGVWLGFDAAVTEILAVSVVGFLYGVAATILRGGIKELPYVFIGGMFQILRSLQGRLAPRKGSGDDVVVEGASARSEEPRQVRRDRPSGWIPFAPAILVGTVIAWVATARSGGFF